MLDLKKVFGSSNDRKVKAMAARVSKINAFEPQIGALTDDQLRAKTQDFKARVAAGAWTFSPGACSFRGDTSDCPCGHCRCERHATACWLSPGAVAGKRGVYAVPASRAW